ncbi:metallophosphoesterase family protein [Flavobacterium sp.]|uniref:metallophosphoesterase family protein n=1 Tax=Flavobacterium sp. TaxID=239 RepID=UPI00286E2B0C|nr:metallophosphoesterase family protein [Flavobacterium sp.]
MSRTLVVGDIHGGLRALKQVIEKANITLNDTLVFLGDYVDGWSESPQVIDFLIELDQKQKCVFIRGNHDELLLEWLSESKDNLEWYKHGGEATVLAYSFISSEIKRKHIDFLKSLKNYFIDSKNRLFVHAGFTNMNGVDYEYFPKLLYWDRTLWETALALDQNIEKNSALYPKRFRLYHEIYIGHTPVTRIGQTIPIQKAGVWNIDTGAAFLGPLTILNIDTKEFWQSNNLPDLYPNENGRN